MTAGWVRRRGVADGQTLVEFALVLPVLVLVLVAVFDVGRAVVSYNTLADAARQGTRVAVVDQTEATIKQRVRDLTTAAAVAVTDSDVGVSYVGAACSPVKLGCTAVVTVVSSYQPLTPIVGQIIGSIDLRAESRMPVENIP